MYQPNAAAYQQLLQPFVPVSCEYAIRANNSASAFTGVNLNKPTLPFYVRHNVPTSTPQQPNHPTVPTLPIQNNSIPSIPTTLSSSSYPSVMSNFQHFQHPFFSDLLAAQQQLTRFQAAHTVTTPSVTGPTTVPAVINNNNNNEDLISLQPFKKIRRDV